MLSGSFLPLNLLAQRYGVNGPLVPGAPPFGPDAPFCITPSMMDDRIFNFREILPEGPNSGQNNDFEAHNITLDHQFLDGDAGIEVAFEKQSFDSRHFSGLAGDRTFGFYLDFNRELLDGRPNPNFGGISTYAVNRGEEGESDWEAFRVTAFYDLDFREKFGESTLSNILGKTIFTLLYNTQEITTRSTNFSDTPDPIVAQIQPAMATNNNLWNASNYRAFPVFGLGSGQTILDLPNKADLVNIDIGGISAYQPKRNSGTFSMWSQANQRCENFTIPIYHQFHRPELAVVGANQNHEEIESYAIIAQSYLLRENLVTTVGWRRDQADQFNADNPPADPAFFNRRLNISDPNWKLPDEPTQSVKDEVWSYSGVFHMPSQIMENLPGQMGLSFHYSESSNFIPQGRRIDLEGQLIVPPSGETTEYGFTFTALDQKLSLRVNWYETSQVNTGAYGPQVANQTTRVLRQGLESINHPVNAAFDVDDLPIPSQTFEKFINDFVIPEFIESSFGDLVITSIPNAPTVREAAQNENVNPFRLQKLQDGGPVGELKEWQWALISKYEFTAGRFNGLGIGGAYRWQDESTIGFPVVIDPDLGPVQDVRDPFFGPSQSRVDA